MNFLFFAALFVQGLAVTDPLWHSFTELPFPLDTTWISLKATVMIGSPIFFSGSNETAVYNDYTWFNPCFTRALSNPSNYVAFWFVGEDAYCTVHVTPKTGTASSTLPFAKTQLARVEYPKIRCE